MAAGRSMAEVVVVVVVAVAVAESGGSWEVRG